MSLFDRTYKDTIKALKKEQKTIKATNGKYASTPNTSLTTSSTTNTILTTVLNTSNASTLQAIHNDASHVYTPIIYTSHMYNISDVHIQPIDSKHYYKKSFDAKHKYRFGLDNCNLRTRKVDPFEDVYNLLPQLYDDNPYVDADFLTGYYFAKYVLAIKGQSTGEKITSFHSGLSSDGITRGLFYAFASLPKPIKWDFYGCDKKFKKEYANKYINSKSIKCDVFDINSVRSINIQISEKIKSFDFYISDVRPTDLYDTMCQLILCTNKVKGFTIIRLPTIWKAIFTAMTNLLLYLISQYNIVKIFKTPWGLTPKFYLIIGSPKEPYSAVKYTGLIKYMEAVKIDRTLPLYNTMIFDVEDVDNSKPDKEANVNNNVDHNSNNKSVDIESNDDDTNNPEEESNDDDDDESNDDESNDDESKDISNADDHLKPKSYTSLFVSNVKAMYYNLMTYDEDIDASEANITWLDIIGKNNS